MKFFLVYFCLGNRRTAYPVMAESSGCAIDIARRHAPSKWRYFDIDPIRSDYGNLTEKDFFTA